MRTLRRFPCLYFLSFCLLTSFVTGYLAADQIPLDALLGTNESSSFDLVKVFQGCPIIYILLMIMSLASCILWLYSILTLRLSNMMPAAFLQEIRQLFLEKRFDTALVKCKEEPNFLSTVIAAGLKAAKHGPQVMIDVMQAEGRRCSSAIWQRISLLNEIATIAPMLGLLGTVIGLFFAFYDSSRSEESIMALFDGLGIAIGTTVVGLVVAILAMIFYTMLKFRVVSLLNTIENESLALVSIIDPPSIVVSSDKG